MSAQSRHAARKSELIDQGTPFVQATVVRAQCPTSARPGDAAIVLSDGSIEGFVGGQCAEGSVRVAAVPLLETGSTLLLRILPESDEEFPESEGAITVVNPCLSGGAIEVFLEPQLPSPRVAIVGNTPIADALAQFGAPLGFRVDPAFGVDTAQPGVPDVRGCLAVLISSHGRNEPETIRAALDAGVGFIGLVASPKRGSAVLAELDLSDDERARVHSPVGFDIGAKTAEEIAVSILASLVQAVRKDGLKSSESRVVDLPESAIDPVCGMTVMVAPDTAHLSIDGVDHWFCNPGCRTRYAEEVGAAG